MLADGICQPDLAPLARLADFRWQIFIRTRPERFTGLWSRPTVSLDLIGKLGHPELAGKPRDSVDFDERLAGLAGLNYRRAEPLRAAGGARY